MSECERCNGDGEIVGEVETVLCPNCEDVCQWCNNRFEDGEQLGDSGLWVCRDCIRDMAAYKEDVGWQFIMSTGVDNIVDDADELRAAISERHRQAFREFGISTDSVPDEWIVRDDTDAQA